MWSLYEIIHIWTAVVDELKLENLLRWSFFTFIYNRSSYMNYFIYTSHHFTPHRKMWTQLIDLTPNLWLHSSVGRASHRYRGGHGFESCWSPVFFRLLLSSCLNWKIYGDDHSSYKEVSSDTDCQNYLDVLTVPRFANIVQSRAKSSALLSHWPDMAMTLWFVL